MCRSRGSPSPGAGSTSAGPGRRAGTGRRPARRRRGLRPERRGGRVVRSLPVAGPSLATGHRLQDPDPATLLEGRSVGRRQALAPRAEMGGPGADDDPPDRPATPWAALTGALVDLEPLLHLAVAVGCRVVVDRAASPFDRLGQDGADREVQAALVGRMERRGGTERMEARQPERLVGVDVADPGNERLVEHERLEARLAGP